VPQHPVARRFAYGLNEHQMERRAPIENGTRGVMALAKFGAERAVVTFPRVNTLDHSPVHHRVGLLGGVG